jgi:hypothetical protein
LIPCNVLLIITILAHFTSNLFPNIHGCTRDRSILLSFPREPYIFGGLLHTSLHYRERKTIPLLVCEFFCQYLLLSNLFHRRLCPNGLYSCV